MTSAQRSAHAREEFGQAKRLADIVLGAELKAGNFVHFASLCRQHDDGHRAPLTAQIMQNLKAVALREHDIEDDEIGLECPAQFESGFTVSSHVDDVVYHSSFDTAVNKHRIEADCLDAGASDVAGRAESAWLGRVRAGRLSAAVSRGQVPEHGT